MKLQLLTFMFFISFAGIAQVGIGTTMPDGSAALDVVATNKGFLMPRMTTVQKDAIVSPAEGLQVYDTDTKHVWTYDGVAWIEGAGGAGKFVDGATPDIAYYAGKVGIGRDNFGNAHKLWVEGNKDTDGVNTTAKIVANYNGTGTSAATYGLAGEANNNSSGTITSAAGTIGGVVNKTGGILTAGYGSWNYIQNSGTVVAGYGVLGTFYNQAGSAQYAEGGYFGIENDATINAGTLGDFYVINNGTMTDLYGVYMQYMPSSTGTVTNSYGLYIDYNFNQGTGLNYALYSSPDINSYLEGNLGVGTSDPQQKVHINGVMRLEPQDSAPTGGLGDLYVNDNDKKLYFHNGTEWKEVQLN